MLSDVLDYSLNKRSINRELNLLKIIKESMVDALKISKREDVNIEVEVEPDIYINFDEVKLKRVFMNILLNALQSMGEGHDITITSDFMKNKSHITITNTGSSISKDIVKEIFSPGFSTKTHGNGVGLAIVKKFIEETNSEIKCESDSNSVSFKISFQSSCKLLDISENSWNF